jgi:hypothetical protein
MVSVAWGLVWPARTECGLRTSLIDLGMALDRDLRRVDADVQIDCDYSNVAGIFN